MDGQSDHEKYRFFVIVAKKISRRPAFFSQRKAPFGIDTFCGSMLKY
jgi:hypothetical protein